MAGWQESSPSTRGSGSRSSSARKKGSTTPTPSASDPSYNPTLFQARLDRISQPTAAYWTSYVRWWRASVGLPEAVLQARLAGISRDIGELARLVKEPPSSWTGLFWLAMEARLRGWQGQAAALAEEAARRRMMPPR